MAFALFNLYWSRGSPLVAFAQTDSSGRLTTQCHALTLICPTILSRLSPRTYRHDRVFVCACTHYLVFKEPTSKAPKAPCPSQPKLLVSLGEPTEFITAAIACQAISASISNFLFEAWRHIPARLNSLSGNAGGLTWQYFRATVSSRHQGCLAHSPAILRRTFRLRAEVGVAWGT